TEDCKWGHCYACGVPGNGEDTKLATAMPSVAVPEAGPRAGDPSAYRDVAKGAAYRQKAMPDLPSAARTPRAFTGAPRRYRIAFAKTGDARFLSHRNTMDVFERAIRAAGLPARYSEGFNPHMKLSMGPALPLGLESLHEVFDVEAVAGFPGDAAALVAAKLPDGISVLEVRELGPADRSLSKVVKSARYAVRLESEDQIARAGEAVANGWREAVPALRALSLETSSDGTRLRFEVNLDQSSGETTTPKKVLERLLTIPPEAQAGMSVTREATVLG
ncbi:MAG TPA: TIGR03936 family radical SAM-associated protein, partial [Thermoanaerobaculia bacterium]